MKITEEIVKQICPIKNDYVHRRAYISEDNNVRFEHCGPEKDDIWELFLNDIEITPGIYYISTIEGLFQEIYKVGIKNGKEELRQELRNIFSSKE